MTTAMTNIPVVYFVTDKTYNMTILLALFAVLLIWAISDNGKENQRFLKYREREARDFEK